MKEMITMGTAPAYTQTTHGISVSVVPMYLKNQSDPCENNFVWAYHICIENKGSQTLQLISRYWKITDAVGRAQEVRGDGVVGEQPILHPGGKFEYTSSVSLTLPSGVMVGTYKLQNVAGDSIEVSIPLFSLDAPQTSRTVH